MKKILSCTGIFILILGSFFLTNKIANIFKSNNPIIKEILNNSNSYESNVVEAIIKNNTIIPGINGCKINVGLTYDNISKIGTFNESEIVYNIIYPKEILNNNLDKYIISGNKNKRNISLLFKIDKNIKKEKFEELLNTLKNANIEASIFVDGIFLKENYNLIKEINNNNLEILNLGYDEKYEESSITMINVMLSELNYNNPKICLIDDYNQKYIEICKNNNMKSVMPSIVVNKNPLTVVKNTIENGSIIFLKLNDDVLEEFNLITNYIKKKGYKIKKLSTLIDEDNKTCSKYK